MHKAAKLAGAFRCSLAAANGARSVVVVAVTGPVHGEWAMVQRKGDRLKKHSMSAN